MEFEIRNYHPSDLVHLYRICLLTGNSGRDASKIYKDPDILGHFFAAPYAVLEPRLACILTHSGRPVGYILGTQNSSTFYENCERLWFPVLRSQYPLPDPGDDSADARIIRLMHQGHRVNKWAGAYPAHLHIDILPQGQGSGMGRRLMETFLGKLRQLRVTGVHLGVGKANQGAIKFYDRLGFSLLEEQEHALILGLKLTAENPV